MLAVTVALASIAHAQSGDEIKVVLQYKQDVTLNCGEAGADAFVYNQTKEANGNLTHVKMESGGKITVTGQSAVIKDLRREEIDGVYTCRTGPTADDLKKTFKKQVGPFFYTPEKRSVTITEGGPVDLTCKLLYGGENPVTFEWIRDNNTTLSDGGRYKIVNDANSTRLTILKVEDADKGHFNCTASNEFGSHNEAIQLRVKDQLAALWPFLAIVAEVIVLCLIILIYEKRCNKKPSTNEEDTDAAMNLMGKDSSDVKKRSVKA